MLAGSERHLGAEEGSLAVDEEEFVALVQAERPDGMGRLFGRQLAERLSIGHIEIAGFLHLAGC